MVAESGIVPRFLHRVSDLPSRGFDRCLTVAPRTYTPSQELIDEYYAACQDGVDTNVAGEVEEWNVVSAPQVKLLAEQCGCAGAERAHAAALWLLGLAVVGQFALLQ
eukprot:COSAG02_NODE_113_length_35905_cov_25.229012_4_plen_107_part_00